MTSSYRKNNLTTNESAGFYLAEEMFYAFPKSAQTIRLQFAKYFNARQTKRLSYLFSVAPTDRLQHNPDIPAPPSPADMFSTHDLLDSSFEVVMHCLESILTQRSYLLAENPTLADLSCFGQINMLCLLDKGTRKSMESMYPKTVSWIDSLQNRCFSHTGQVRFGRELTRDQKPREPLNLEISNVHEFEGPLVDMVRHIFDVFIPLMQLNERAYLKYRASGETVFNEQAFWQRRSMYEGAISGKPIKSVVKTFQVYAWRQLKLAFAELSISDRQLLHSSLNLQEPSISDRIFRNDLGTIKQKSYL